MNKIFTLAACILALCGVGSMHAVAATVPFDGEGTESSPYLLQTKEDLIALSGLTCTNNYGDVATGAISGFRGVVFKLTNDIDLEYSDDFKGICFSSNAMVLKSLKFQGTFDGDGHTIHRLKIDGIVWDTAPGANGSLGTPNTVTSKDALSFIGILGAGGTVKNLRMADDCRISSYKTVGGIVARAEAGSTIDNCRNYADVTSYAQYAGGIVGFAYSGTTITNCYNAGNITSGNAFAGGIGGHVMGSIKYCANAGDIAVVKNSMITATYCRAGGIAGSANDEAPTDNLNAGNVTATGDIGGIAGDIQATVNCINYGMVSSTTASTTGGIAGICTGTAFGPKSSNCLYDSQIFTGGAVSGNIFYGITDAETSALTSGEPIEGFDTGLWQFDAGKYPVLKQFADEPKLAKARCMVATIATGETASSVTSDITLANVEGLTWSLNDGAKFTITGNKVVGPGNEMTEPDILTATFGDVVKRIPILYTGSGVATGPFAGEGTEESPYLLQTKEDLITLSKLTSTNNSVEAPSKLTYEGKFFRLTNDIDLEYSEEFEGISVSSLFTLQNYIRFCGTIDGDGHTIHRMKIGKIIWTVAPEDAADGIGTVDSGTCNNVASYSSFIGRLGAGGVVKNLNIASDCHIVGYSCLGGIVASMTYGSLVENCRNYADVTAYSSLAGGIASEVADGARISGCYNAGNITTGIMYAGGIAGNNKGTIEHCANTGNVSGLHLTTNIPENEGFFSGIGGITGEATASASITTNCINTGTITGEEQVGGILGSFGMSKYCLNYGIVCSKDLAKSGNIFGNKANMGGKFPEKLYYDCQINKVRAVSNEDFTFNPGDGGDKVQVTIATLTSALTDGQPLEGLDTELWQFDNGMYPTLKKFASEPKMNAARRIVAQMFPNNNAAVVNLPITLHPSEGLVWSSSEHFRIANGTAVPVKTGAATITARIDDLLEKTFYIAVLGTSDLEEIMAEKEVAEATYYTPAGIQVPKPADCDGQLYIVILKYTDGTTRSIKMLNK